MTATTGAAASSATATATAAAMTSTAAAAPTGTAAAAATAAARDADSATAHEAEIAGAPQATLIAAGALIEAAVLGSRGTAIGKVAEIMLAGGEGRIAYVVVASGGVLGIGETLHALPWGEFTVDPQSGRLSVAHDALDPATAFDKDHWPTGA